MLVELFKKLSFSLPKFYTFPTVKADDDDDDDDEPKLVDPQIGLRAWCGKQPKGIPFKQKWDECEKRVRSRKRTLETCEEELLEYYQYVDQCAAKTLFEHLK